MEVRTQGAGFHLLEAQRDHAVRCAALHGLPRQKQRRGPGRAVVVDVDHRDAGHAHRVQRTLSAGGIAIHVADIGLLDALVIDACIGQGATCRLGAHVVIRFGSARLGEGHHAHAGNNDGLTHW